MDNSIYSWTILFISVLRIRSQLMECQWNSCHESILVKRFEGNERIPIYGEKSDRLDVKIGKREIGREGRWGRTQKECMLPVSFSIFFDHFNIFSALFAIALSLSLRATFFFADHEQTQLNMIILVFFFVYLANENRNKIQRIVYV